MGPLCSTLKFLDAVSRQVRSVFFIGMNNLTGLIDPYQRYQKDLRVRDLFPTRYDFTCACGCGVLLTGKKTRWAFEDCSDKAYITFAILKGNMDIIRDLIFSRDNGYCRSCGVYEKKWEADHILPVQWGGGACGLDNFQTLCQDCHKKKTKIQILSHRSLCTRLHFPLTI